MEKIKVLFDANIILNNYNSKTSGRSGIFWTAFNIAKQLAKRKEISLFLYSDNLKIINKFLNDFSTELCDVKIFDGNIKEMDIFFSPVFKVPDVIRNTGIPCYTILYDCIPLIFPEYFSLPSEHWFRKLISSLNNNDYCLSISEYTTKDFLHFCPKLDKNKIFTIPLATNFEYKPNKNKNLLALCKKKYNIPQDKKYLFSLCSLEPRKNLIRSVRSFLKFIDKNKIEDLVFVLGGGAWAGFIKKFEKEVPEYKKYKDKIIIVGYVDDEDLEILYSNTEWFVYTSQYEGFGMPPLEAMSCGCPVITSNNSSLPEVVGDAGIMINWDSDEQHVKAYEQYYFDKKYRDEMAKKGLERSKLFSWEKTADIIIEAFEKRDLTRKRTSFNLSDLIKQNNITKISVKLFNFIPLFKYKQIGGRKVYKILGLPIFKIRKMANGITTKCYFLGIPILKVSKKI